MPRNVAENQIEAAAAEVDQWRQHALNKTASSQRATRVWTLLVEQRDQMGEMLELAASDQRDELPRVLELQRWWSHRAHIVRRVQELDYRASKSRREDIVDSSLERTNQRVKVVFAGLHNVQRLQEIPNRPFAHLGSPN